MTWLRLCPILILSLVTGLATVPASAQTNPAEAEALSKYHTAKAAGRLAEATSYVLDYMVETKGANDPLTVDLTHTYGNQLREEGDIREAVDALKLARERAIAAFGEHDMRLFVINLDLGEAYVDRKIGVGAPMEYFEYALEVLRQNDQRETSLYVRTLMGVTSRLIQAGALGGTFSTNTQAVEMGNLAPSSATSDRARSDVGSGRNTVDYKYDSGYQVVSGYMQEAALLADLVDIEDPYLGAKIEVVKAKTKIIETLYWEIVPPTVRGSISGTVAHEKYQQEDDNLLSAIDVLMADPELNQGFMDIANSARMDIAWLSEDMQYMSDLCSSDTLNMAADYPPDRLFEVTADGDVIAPGFSFRISKNIFEKPKASEYSTRNLTQQDDRERPQFIPVCINGRLMAALVNTPVVLIEDFE